jgi:spermidine synthase
METSSRRTLDHHMQQVAAHRSRHLALALMVASGFAALGYQIIWTQQSTLWLGHESAAVLAVVAAFFGGLAVGALALAPSVDRSPRPERWYAGCEAMMGLWSLALALLLAPITRWLLEFIGPQPSPVWHWSVAFSGTFLLLLPATAAMGATLPAMERVFARLRSQGAPIAVLYAGNTLGALLGALTVAFVLIPALGLVRSATVCAVLNFICAVLALRISASPGSTATMPGTTPATTASLWLLAATGLLGIGYEVLVIRVLSQIAENTVYTFALLLGVYLIGTTLGAAVYSRWLTRCEPQHLRDTLLRALAGACLLGALSLAASTTIKAWLLETVGTVMVAALAVEAGLATAAFLLPTLLMGALFSHLATTARAAGTSFGLVLGVNTLGAAAAPLLFGVLLVPALGPKLTLLALASGYLALAAVRSWTLPVQWATATAIVLMLVWAPSLLIVDIPVGGRLLSHHEGVMAAVSVVEDANGVATLHIDNRQQEGSSATLLADARQGLLPILLHPTPKRALFLGLGTGATAFSAAEDPQLQVDAVELLPEVIAASAQFRKTLEGGASHGRLHVLRGDARRYVRSSDQQYEVIVADNFHPARSGSGSLYTVEHFAAVRERLVEGGVFCQWLPLHQLDLDTLRSIVRSFLVIYPHGWAMLATNSLETPVVGLIARRGVGAFDIAEVRERLAQVNMPRSPAQFGIADDLALLGSFFAGPRSLRHFAGNAMLNTDDHPVVVYRAPRLTYAPDSLPRDRLLALLQAVALDSRELLATADPALSSRLMAYWTARNSFIAAGRNVQPTTDVRRMLAQVRVPLLAILQISPDFRPAYDPLLQMAAALTAIDVIAARALLLDLMRSAPARPEAAQLLHELPAVP